LLGCELTLSEHLEVQMQKCVVVESRVTTAIARQLPATEKPDA